MATVVLVRHARSTANVSGVLTGRQKGVHLDELGREQAQRVAQRLAVLPLAALVSSPLERCRETAAAIAKAQPDPVRVATDKGLVECDYGAWEGRAIKDLAREKLWKAVQRHPSGVTFPEGEPMAAMAARVVDAVRRHDARVEQAHGPNAVWAAVTHGDPLKVVLADALGLHLDQFQRIQVDPSSVSVVRLTAEATYLLQSNTHDGDLSWLAPRGKGRAPRTGVVGGGAGPGH